jgi:hypothetical protein
MLIKAKAKRYQSSSAAYQARIYPGFCAIKQFGSTTPLDGMLVHCRLASQLSLVPIHTPGWRVAGLDVLLRDT